MTANETKALGGMQTEMPVFVWDARYEVGVPMVDTQHRRLVGLLNTLGELYARGASERLIRQVFEGLAAYAVYHFQMEEGLMAKYGIDTEHEASHKAAHAAFADKAFAAMAKVHDDPMGATGELLTFLTKWLIYHILGVDQRMAAEIHAIERGESKESAKEIAEKAMTESSSVLLEAFNHMYENLSARTHAYWEASHRLKSEIRERKRAELQLAARLKEATCLGEIAAVMEKRELSIRVALEQILAIAPKAWPQPVALRLASAMGEFGSTVNPAVLSGQQSTVMVDGAPFGVLSFGFKGQEPSEDEHNPELLGHLAERIGEFIERRQAQDARRKLSLAVEQSPVSIVITDKDGAIEYVNACFSQLTGYRREEVLGKNPSILKSGETPIEQYHAMWHSLKAGRTWEGEFHNRKKNGETYWESANISPILNSAGEITHYLAVKQDVTQRKLADSALRDSNTQLSMSVAEMEAHAREMTLLNRMSDLIQTCVTQEEACRVVAETAGDLFNQLGGAMALKSHRENYLETVAQWGQGMDSEPLFTFDDCWAMRRGQAHDVMEGRNSVRCNHFKAEVNAPYLCLPMSVVGETLGLVTLLKPVGVTAERLHNWRQVAVAFAESIKMSISNLKLREALREQAIRDPLTGLHNRRYLQSMLPRELSRAVRAQRTLALVMMDVDHFKRFNDTYGHKAGDLVLQEVARAIESSLRNSDLACRYGGEEFVLVMPEVDRETAFSRIESLRAQVAGLSIQFDGPQLPPVTLSAGIACCPDDGVDEDLLLRDADLALYSAKQAGRNRIALYSPGMDEGAVLLNHH